MSAPTGPGRQARLRLSALFTADQVGFVGRAAELASMAEVLRWVRNGSGQIVLVEGDAGVGKTRLVNEAASGEAVGGFQGPSRNGRRARPRSSVRCAHRSV